MLSNAQMKRLCAGELHTVPDQVLQAFRNSLDSVEEWAASHGWIAREAEEQEEEEREEHPGHTEAVDDVPASASKSFCSTVDTAGVSVSQEGSGSLPRLAQPCEAIQKYLFSDEGKEKGTVKVYIEAKELAHRDGDSGATAFPEAHVEFYDRALLEQ
eukprot:gnl/TRDRNA2_/TRDRNA2_86984_c0_seq2.p1 gnl/TRDRNA2_/TRDRNA2_86984_c0~~gnl/TRDRNA2_/TRDRNA2_86984_c0_seq2.p1  ORF type:complete len:157 (-),score=41.41 gnl/TRDRNA2_/TRDRNA2_86984_c0_seq2:60-530(-)